MELTRRRSRDIPDCWQVYYGDVHVGTVAKRAGVPSDVDQWGWDCGFYPRSHHGHHVEGTAETFEIARAEFEQAWLEYLPQCTEVDFAESRREGAFRAWKYKMWETHHQLPTQTTAGRSRCFCGAELTIASVPGHVHGAHMDLSDEVHPL